MCKEIIALIPVYETESWMLANKELLRKYIGTNKTDFQIGIDGHPESLSRPKEKIEEAIKIGRRDLPKKRRNEMTLEDLYSILGESIAIEDLKKYRSFQDFEMNIRNALRKMHLIY
jgi:hypothetical protein